MSLLLGSDFGFLLIMCITQGQLTPFGLLPRHVGPSSVEHVSCNKDYDPLFNTKKTVVHQENFQEMLDQR
jgi:hypothetical protein